MSYQDVRDAASGARLLTTPERHSGSQVKPRQGESSRPAEGGCEKAPDDPIEPFPPPPGGQNEVVGHTVVDVLYAFKLVSQHRVEIIPCEEDHMPREIEISPESPVQPGINGIPDDSGEQELAAGLEFCGNSANDFEWVQ